MYAHTSVHLYSHVRSLVRSHVHSSVHSFALRSSPRPLATRTPYVHRVSWSYKSIVCEALKKANQLTKVFRTSDASITLTASRHNGARFPRMVRTNPRGFLNVFFKSPFGAPGWKPGAGDCFLNPISAKFSPKNVRPQLFIFRPLFTYFRILILNKP